MWATTRAETRPACDESIVRRPGRTPRERGASAVEFALVLPILLLVVFGIISYGIVFAAQISLNAAARDAARAGVVQPPSNSPKSCGTIAAQARNSSTTVGVTPTQVGVDVQGPTVSCSIARGSTTVAGSSTQPPCAAGPSGSQLTVTLKYLPPTLVPMVPVPGSLSAKGAFQCEYS